MAKESLHPIPTRYQVYSKEGLSFPIGKSHPPSGYGRAIIFDISNRRARAIATLECWLIMGGGSLFHLLSAEYVISAILSATTIALQLYLLQLAIDIISLSSGVSNRVGGAQRADQSNYSMIKSSNTERAKVIRTILKVSW